MNPRNVLVLVADQLRADHLGFGGNPLVRTPHLDRLAASSLAFRRAFVANPTCMPNRATLVTGRWPSAHGTRTNGISLAPETRTVVRCLRQNGYDTTAVGKLHFQNMGWPWEAYQRDQIAETDPLALGGEDNDPWYQDRSAGWDQNENAQRHHDQYVPMPEDYYGFDHVDLVVGHGGMATGHYRHWARDRGVYLDELAGPDHATARYQGWDQVYRSEIPVEVYPTSYVTSRAQHHLERFASSQDPFFLFVSYPDPHHPFSPPGRYWDQYSPDEVPIPPSFDAEHHRLPNHIAKFLAQRGQPPLDPTMTWAPTEDQLRHAMAAEFGMISMLDDSAGRILGTLSDLGLEDDTVVVFTADHGDLFGDHGLLLKHFVHYEAVTRVPLTVRVPGAATGHTDALVSSADLTPTLLDLLQLPAYRGIQGRSLTPVLADTALQLRPALVIEEDHLFGTDGLPGPVRIRTLISDEGRLTVYNNNDGELYDHEADPDEQTNLFAEPEAAALRHVLTDRLMRELIALDDDGRTPTAGA